MSHWTDSPSYLVDSIAEMYWPTDPDRDGPEAQGLKEFYRQADATPESEITLKGLHELATSLPNTRPVA